MGLQNRAPLRPDRVPALSRRSATFVPGHVDDFRIVGFVAVFAYRPDTAGRPFEEFRLCRHF